MSLIHVIYASVATRPMSMQELKDLLEISRDRNRAAGLTGMLLHARGSFMQVLEGEEDAVDELYGRIEADPRHEQVTRIIREPIARRDFSDWSMGFYDTSPEELAGIVGANDFFGAGSCLDRLEPARARKLLTAFANGRWRQRLDSRATLAP